MILDLSQKLRGAIIGFGHQGKKEYFPKFLKASNCELIAICDSNVSKKQDILPTVKFYTDHTKMIDQENIDFCVVCVPHSAHYQIVSSFLQKNIIALKEKPLSTDLQGALRINKDVELYKTPVLMTLSRRFSRAYENFKLNLEWIGNPLYIDAKYFLNLEVPHSDWRTSKEMSGGGCIIDMGYHFIDLLIWYFGMPQRIYANLSHKILPEFQNIEDTAHISFSYKNGLHGSILLSRFFYPKLEFFKVFGTKGSLTVSPFQIILQSKNGEILKKIDFSSENEFNQIESLPTIIKYKKQYDFCYSQYHLQHAAFIESCYLSYIDRKSINPKKILNKVKNINY